MRRYLPLALLVAFALALTDTTVGQGRGQAPPAAADADEFDLPPDYPPAPPARDEPEPLPAPKLREPFAIGEALNDPARVADAVVSLLALMNIGIVPTGQTMRPVQGAMRLRLTEAEVRQLIDMGVADATNAVIDDPPPDSTYTFADLHKAVAPLLRTRMTAAQLAERYAEAYEKQPESLAAAVLLGQPIEPEMPLLRTQIWLMVADAVVARPAGRAAQAGGARLVLARAVLQSGGGATWGTGAVLSTAAAPPSLSLSDAEWQELVVRLPLLANQSAIRVTPADASAHEGHGGPGAPQVISATFVASSVVSSTTGRPLLQARPGGTGNLRLSWNYFGEIKAHGTFSVPAETPVPSGQGGSWRTTYTPRAEVTRRPTGQVSEASGLIAASIPADQILNALYVVPNQLLLLAHTTGDVLSGAGLTVAWHPQDGIDIYIRNKYNIPSVLINGQELARQGRDYAIGTLARDEDGNYSGELVLSSKSTIKIPSKTCEANQWVHQRAAVTGTSIAESPGGRGDVDGSFYHVLSKRGDYTWIHNFPTEYLRLEFKPITTPKWPGAKGKDPCQDEIGGDGAHRGPKKYIPLNDARWTVPRAGVRIAIPDEGHLRYLQTGDAFSTWSIKVERRK